MNCYVKVLYALETDKIKCNCSKACDDIVYNVAVSTSKWPSLQYKEWIRIIVTLQKIKMFLGGSQGDLYEENA